MIISRLGTRLLELAENVIYTGIATFLVGAALVRLALAGKTTWALVSDFTEQRRRGEPSTGTGASGRVTGRRAGSTRGRHEPSGRPP